MDSFMFYLAHISLVLVCAMFIPIIRSKAKTTIRKLFILFLVELFIWTTSVLAERYCMNLGAMNLVMVFENLTYLGVAFISVNFLFVGIAFRFPSKLKPRLITLLCIIPALTQLVIWTNPVHSFFYISYDYFGQGDILLGWYFYVHTFYSYACLLIGMFYVVNFALHSRGTSYWQAILVIVGSLIPIIVNVFYTLNIGNFNIFSTPIAFTVTTVTYLFGVFRFNLLNVAPIALRMVKNKTSDLYIAVDTDMFIIDYNEPFFNVFSPLIHLRKNKNLRDALKTIHQMGISPDSLLSVIEACCNLRTVINKNIELFVENEKKHYSIEFTPLIVENRCHGCVLLFRDTTRAINDMEEIKRNQTMLIERERLASLGQLIGGIAHNLKTPIMAISARTESLWTLIDEYEDSLSDERVTVEDHVEIANEMRDVIKKIKNHMSYISDIITAVKDQTIQYSTGVPNSFTAADLIKRVKVLMQHELVHQNCELDITLLVHNDLEVWGDINSLVQIVDNMIMNAIQAYNGASGQVRLKVWQTLDAPDEFFISIADDAGGIKKEVQEQLFKQMVTTKGKDGTGLGLYISSSTIVGKFGGKMWFESYEGKGTEFFISIPLTLKDSEMKGGEKQ